MEFQVNVDGRTYNVRTSSENKSTYLIEYLNSEIEISLGDNSEWISLNRGKGEDPIPVSQIGEAIQDHFE
jgi:hypothetical protein